MIVFDITRIINPVTTIITRIINITTTITIIIYISITTTAANNFTTSPIFL